MAFVVKPKAPTPEASVKDGTYPAAVTGITQFMNTHGERIGFEFTISSGPFAGQKMLRSTAPQLTWQSKLAEVIEGITGRELTDKELQGGFDLDELLDASCNVLVLQARSRTGAVYSNVERVFQS
jgi:hypothetical protein